MKNISFEHVSFVSADRNHPAGRSLRRASLLIGASFLLQAAPAWAVNECGPPPPGGGTVTCPPGAYPNGIIYFPPNDLEVVLRPGVVTHKGLGIVSDLGAPGIDIRVLGPVNTQLNSDDSGFALTLRTTGTVFADVDDLIGKAPTRKAALIQGRGSVTLFADTVFGVGGGVEVNEGSFTGTAGSAGTHVRINSVITTGEGGTAIYASSIYGDVRTEVGRVGTSGFGAYGIESVGGLFSRTVFIQAGTVVTTGYGATGIRAFGLDLAVRSGTVDTSGREAIGIETFTSLGNTIIASGSISTKGGLAPGIRAGSNLGDILITSGTISTLAIDPPGVGRSPGIAATSVQGDVTIGSGSVSTAGILSDGITATSTNGDISITSGTISTKGFDSVAIRAVRLGSVTGSLNVDSGGIVTSGGSSAGISVTNPSGRTEIASDTVVTTGASSGGVLAAASQGVDIDSGAISTSGDSSLGIGAVSLNGPIVIASDSISTAGASSTGILADGRGPITIASGAVSTSGAGAPGIVAVSAAGPIAINSGSVVTTGRSVGINALSSGGDIAITSGSVVTQGAGTRFDEGAGILARSDGGRVSIASNSVTTAGIQAFGIDAIGRELVVTSNNVATTGRLANAIFARGSVISVSSGTIGTSGDSASGIVTFVSGAGPTSIRTGSITTQGFDSYGVIATTSGTGAIDVTSDGTIVTTGGSSPGISAESRGAVAVSANNISASGLGSDAIAVSGSTSTVTIRGLVQSSQGFAVRGERGLRQGPQPGGPATVNIAAGGTLRGRVSLTEVADRILNNGIFDAIGTSQFGAGADVFDNNAGGTVRSVNGAATFAGLETFNNRGLIEMRDGATNDSLTLPGSYFGAGAARLGLDVDLAAGTADRLITGAATGSTVIEIQGTGTGRFTSGILLVDGGVGTSATAFSLAGGSSSAYLQSGLRFDAANNDFLLVQLPGTAVFETSRLAGMASRLWYESADAVAAQLDTVRDGRGGRGMSLWVQGWTGEHERDGTQTLAGAGTFDVSFEQDFQGLQGGFDFRTGDGVLGITAGAGRSDSTFVSGNPVDLNVKNIGLYAQGRTGPFWANALAKKDWVEMEIAPGAGLGAEFDGSLFGIQANAGLRVGSGALFAEPSVGLSWVRADLDSFQSGPATVEPGIAESLRARAGLRVGARLPLAGGDLLPFAAVDLYEELEDCSETAFTLGETLRLFDKPIGTRGQAAAGLSFVSTGFEAFVRGEMDFSGDFDSKAVRAGVRVRF